MKFLQVVFRRETAAPVLALTFATIVSTALVTARILWTWKLHYAFLLWNLFLAWIPLVFALLAWAQVEKGAKPRWKFFGLAGIWLLFFPNAPYIFTDVVHLFFRFRNHFWIDLVVVLTCALTGMILGFVSLYWMQGIVRRMAGSMMSWMFIAVVAGLSSVGICIGRFLRFNSWDIVLNPIGLYQGVDSWIESLSRASLAFPVLLAVFLFTAYLMLYALTHLPRPQHIAMAEE